MQPGGGGCDTTLIDTFTLSAPEASEAPTRLMLTPDRREIQQTNGSWYERFDRGSIINTSLLVKIV